MSIDECKRALMTMESNKTPGTDGLTLEFYRFFCNAIGKFMVESFMHFNTDHFLYLNDKVLFL